MTRDTVAQNKIAILATGDEITNGDILNTNAQIIAQKLFKNGMHVGMHLSVSDNKVEIEQAITFLLSTHRALIITGGLGPTSDDITRYALSHVLKRPLIFSETIWANICHRIQSLGYTGTIPEGNRQQALFPEKAVIIPNPHGTAAGCFVQEENHSIFMLPGPPNECLPLVDNEVIPILKKAYFQETFFYDHWLLFGVSEGHIAEKLDAIAKPFACTTGYRLCYPYIEFKIYSHNKQDFEHLTALIQEAVAPYLVNTTKQTASEQLRHLLASSPAVIRIRDLATGGLLENTLQTPETYPYLEFSSLEPMIEIKGLDVFWQKESGHETQLEIRFANHPFITKSIPFRGSRVKQYAVEYICQQIYLFLTTNDTD